MSLRSALLASAASATLLLAACGGGSSGDPPGPASNPAAPTTTGGGPSAQGCPAPAPVTIAGGDVFVARQGPVGVTLLSNGGLADYRLTFMYDYVFGMQVNNQQDKFGQETLFPPGTPVGTSTQVVLREPTPDLTNGATVSSSYPSGIPLELRLAKPSEVRPTVSSSTASIHKDIPNDDFHTATVTYGANNTATVTFFPDEPGAHFSVGLTNVTGSGSSLVSNGC